MVNFISLIPGRAIGFLSDCFTNRNYWTTPPNSGSRWRAPALWRKRSSRMSTSGSSRWRRTKDGEVPRARSKRIVDFLGATRYNMENENKM